MLTTGHVDHFRTFGFAALRGFLADRLSMLRAEADTAVRDAYAATYHERVIGGISGHYLPMAARRTPVSASLVCDDPRLVEAAGQLPGGQVIPECPEGVLYFAEASWHADNGIGVRGVKFAAYFDELTADNRALRLVPGSHHPEQHPRPAAYERRQPRIRTDALPGEQRDRALRSVLDSFELAFRGFDRDHYPVWRDWLDGAAAHPRRGDVIGRMRQAGVLDLPGARDGW